MVLLDTQAYIWFLEGNPRLSASAREAIEFSPRVLLSIASVWEIAIKHSLRKLSLPGRFEDLIEELDTLDRIELCPIESRHIRLVATLPHHHRDPFDRMIIAQALVEGLPIVSSDAQFDTYGVNRIY
ncbi:MAG: type II toxin-antitoxin system VapC family toxin [Fimbriimonas sp.]